MEKKLLFFFLTCLFALSVPAVAQDTTDEPDCLVLETTGGERYTFLFAQQPEVYFYTVHDQQNLLDIHFADDIYWVEALTFDRDEVLDITLANSRAAAIAAPEAADGSRRVTFSLVQPGVVSIEGLATGDHLQVVSADGKTVSAATATAEGRQMVDLGQQPRGLYIVSVNRSFTFKLMKP